jgi:uncharacterized tellurite resistance protein B-like protein
MIRALKALFEPAPEETPAQKRHRQHLAAAALLIETARADFTEDADEQEALQNLLCSTLELTAGEVRELVSQATRQVDQAISLYEFTRVINDYYDAEEKLRLIEDMWAVAFADGDVDKYEEHLIRQVASLVYVSHEDYIRCKMAAQP